MKFEDNPLLSALASLVVMTELAARKNEIFCDEVETSIGKYYVETGPCIFKGGLVTVCAIEQRDRNGQKTIIGPCGVQAYETLEEAKEGHAYWLNLCRTNPPLFLKDAITNKVYSVALTC